MATLLRLRMYALFLLLLPMDSLAQTIPDPEILYYKFDGVGTQLVNYALTPPAGTDTANIMGILTQGGSGQCNGALIGTGTSSTNDYVNTGWAPNLSGVPWTISFWTSNIGSSSTLFYIFGDVNSGSFRCFTNGVAGSGNWILRGSMTDVLVNGGASVAPSMTTFVYNPVSADIKAYLNGVLVNTVAQSGPVIVGSGPFKVGGYSSNVGLPAGGLMDEFRFYDRALDLPEIELLYNRQNTDTVSVTACDSLVSPSGNYTWTTSGVYNDTITNIYCGDSVIVTNLTINQSTSGSFNQTSCDSYISPSGLYTWTSSGTYMDTIPNAAGCDSVLTIDLTILMSSSVTLTVESCDSYISPSGLYTWTSSGTYMDTIPNAIGCDSLITIDLTILTPSSATLTAESCDSYISPSGLYTWTSSGTYMDTIPNAAGCDSIITIDLTVITIDTSVSVSGGDLTVNTPADSYQWINCATSMAIPGAVSQVYSASSDGEYAVVITEGNCSDTSSCINVVYFGLQEENPYSISVFPNPAEKIVHISNPTQQELTIHLYDQQGKLISSTVSGKADVEITVEAYDSGIYLLKTSVQGTHEQLFKLIHP